MLQFLFFSVDDFNFIVVALSFDCMEYRIVWFVRSGSRLDVVSRHGVKKNQAMCTLSVLIQVIMLVLSSSCSSLYVFDEVQLLILTRGTVTFTADHPLISDAVEYGIVWFVCCGSRLHVLSFHSVQQNSVHVYTQCFNFK